MKRKLFILILLTLLAASLIPGCDDDDKRYQLKINFNGGGSGTVTGEKFRISCSGNSEYSISEQESVTLKAEAQDGSLFVGWSGDCTSNGDTCTFTMDGEKSVTATYAKRGIKLSLKESATYRSGAFNKGASEITAYDPATGRIFQVNGDSGNIDVLDAVSIVDSTGDSVEQLEKISEIDLSSYGKSANSVAFRDGVLAAAVENVNKQEKGKVVFFDADGKYISSVECGALPDMVTFTPDGKKVLVANEGEPDDSYTVDPEGSVTIIDISSGASKSSATTAGFTSFNNQIEKLKSEGVRIFGPGATVAQDLEPEYIAVSPDSGTAWVTLQENNALAEIDLASGTVTRILPLGFKDHSVNGNGLDASDKDNRVNITTWPVYGMYLPDSITAFEIGGQVYLATANEGDSRDYSGFSEEARVKDLTLDPAAFPNAAALQKQDALGRLKVTTTLGDIDGDGDYDRLYSFGARSFTIWKPGANGLELVYDSGDDLETLTASMIPELFNASSDSNIKDDRSDDKGPEPEGIDTGTIDGRSYIFVGLERVGGVMVYDVTVPSAPSFVTYINNRNASGTPETGTAGDLAPEGINFVDASESISGRPLLIVGNEVSGTTTVYTIDQTAGNISFALFSDPHFYDTSLGTSGAAFERYLASDRKMLLQSESILKSVTDKITADKDLDFLIVSGDLTKDGEELCHRDFAEYLKTVEDAGIKVYVVPGNHDINNPHAVSFAGDSTTPVDNVSPAQFEEIYSDFGYGEALYRDPYSLSYVAEPADGIWILAMDSCDYNDNASLGSPVTSGKFSSETLGWIEQMLSIAEAQGKTVIGTMHHGILEHFTGQSVSNPGSEYVVEDWESVSETVAGDGLRVVFTGHFHANDITSKEWSDAAGGTFSLTDVETGSLVTYPSPYRVVNLDSERKATVQTRYVQNIDYDTGDRTFSSFSRDFITEGVQNLAYTLFTAPVEYGGYGLDADMASVVAPQFADAFIAHYAGDESPDTTTMGTISYYLGSSDESTRFLGASLYSLWTDLEPRDSSTIIDLNSAR